ncbi:hypothetical protein [Terrabacter aeriphilus]
MSAPRRVQPDVDLPYAARDVLSAAELARHGIDSHQVRRLVRCGRLHRLCTGWYATRCPEDAVDRHVLLARAVLRQLDGRAALSHHSLVVLAGLPVWRADLSAVHVTRVADQVTRRRPHVVSHSAVPGLVPTTPAPQPGPPAVGPLVPLAVAVVQTGLVAGSMDAAICADAALRCGLVTAGSLREAAALLSGHRGIRATVAALERCDGRHESPGETRLAHLLADLGLSVTPQLEVATRLGTRRADFRIDGTRVLIEFDGKVKYTDPRHGGDVLWQEKRRQDALEDEGWTVVRVTWSDLDRPEVVWNRIRAAISRSRPSDPAAR